MTTPFHSSDSSAKSTNEMLVQMLSETTPEQIESKRKAMVRSRLRANMQAQRKAEVKHAEESSLAASFSEADSAIEAQLEEEISYQDSNLSLEQADLEHKRKLQASIPSYGVVVITFALTSMLIPFCIDMYLSSFPVMAKSFGVGISSIEFSLSIFFIGIALGQFLWGPVSDSYGRKNITIVSFIAVIITSIMLANTNDISMFYLFRFLQGFMCAAILVTPTSILRDIYETKDFVRINGVITLVFFAAPFLAPLVGTYIAAYFEWHAVFYSIAILGVFSLALFAWIVPETINPMFKRKFEILGTAKTMWQVLRDGRSFWIIMLLSFSSCIIFSYVSMASGVFQTFYDVTATQFPYLFMVNIVGQSIFNIINTRLVKSVEPPVLLQYGILWTLGAGVVAALLAVFDTGFYGILLGIFLTMAGSPLIFLNTFAVYLEIHYKHSGTASSLVNMSRWIIPGIVTSIVQQVDPHRGYTMLMMMAICSFLVVLAYVMYRICERRFQVKQAASNA